MKLLVIQLLPTSSLFEFGSRCLSLQCAASRPQTIATSSFRIEKFDPLSLQIAKGAAMVIVNDDGELVHHAYIESAAFNFDSGDHQPGSRTRVVFPVTGDFNVLCGIHPKMKLFMRVH